MILFQGYHWADPRTRAPKPYLVFYPAILNQSEIREVVHILPNGICVEGLIIEADPVTKFEDLRPRDNYETAHPVDLKKYGPTKRAPLGSVVQARSGDKVSQLDILHRVEIYFF